MRDTSLLAYDKVKHSGFSNYQKEMAIQMLEKEDLCARDMAERLGVQKYTFRPRISELQQAGKIQDSCARKTFNYTDREGKPATSSEIIWQITPKCYQSGVLF